MQRREDLALLVDLAVKHDLYLISDEIYARLSYVSPHVCVSGLDGALERTVLLGGFSKAYAMTGWRVGYLCASKAIADLAIRIHQYTMLCAAHVSQLAALEAVTGGDDDVQEMVADYDRRRRVFHKGLCESVWTVPSLKALSTRFLRSPVPVCRLSSSPRDC